MMRPAVYGELNLLVELHRRFSSDEGSAYADVTQNAHGGNATSGRQPDVQ
jgi:hypothetical protein